jgi:hypothetical protein
MKRIEIDNRKVNISKEDRIIAVEGENFAEKIIFVLARNQNGVDLSEAECTLYWINDLGSDTKGLPLEVKGGSIEVEWDITTYETGASGALNFELMFTKGELIYKTISNYFVIVKSLEEDITQAPEYPTLLADLRETAELAQEQGDYAQEQGDYAKAQGDYAGTQGDYAKEQGDYAKTHGERAEGIADDLESLLGSDFKGDPSTLDYIGVASTEIDLSNRHTGVYGTIDNPLIIDSNAEITFTGLDLPASYQKTFKIYIKRTEDVSVTWGNIAAWANNAIPLLPLNMVCEIFVETSNGTNYYGKEGDYWDVQE